MNSRKPRRDDDKKSGGRPRISPKSSNSFSRNNKDGFPKKLENSGFGDTPKRKYSSEKTNDFPEKRPYVKRNESSEEKPFKQRSREENNFERRPFNKRTEESNQRPFTKKPFGERDNSEKRPYTKRPLTTDKPYGRKPFEDRGDKEKRPYTKRPLTGDKPYERKPYGDRDAPEKRSYTKRPLTGDKPYERKPYGDKDAPEKRSYTKRSLTGDKPYERKPYGDRDAPEKRSYTKRPLTGDKPYERKPYGDRDTPEKRSYTKRSSTPDKPYGRKPYEDRGEQEKRPYSKQTGFNNKREFPSDRRESSDFKRPYPKKPYMKREGDFQKKTFGNRKEDGDTDYIRLNRYLSNAGICSRREADDLISSGVITVNGQLVTELGTKVHRENDVVRYNNEPVRKEKLQYILMNKPKDFITTTEDPQERRTVSSLVERLTSARVYPVGRLDRNTTGVLLLTNDGDLTMKLTHPKFGITKVYAAELDKKLRQDDFIRIKEGLMLDDGPIKVDDVAYIEGMDKNHIGVQLHSGRNRIVRRIFESLGYKVLKLDRTSFATLSKKGLKRGDCRFLTPAEVGRLKNLKS